MNLYASIFQHKLWKKKKLKKNQKGAPMLITLYGCNVIINNNNNNIVIFYAQEYERG